MFHVPINIADNDNGDGLARLLFFAFWVVVAIVIALSKAIAKSREQRQAPRGPRPKPPGVRPSGADDFLEAIRKIARGEAGPEPPA